MENDDLQTENEIKEDSHVQRRLIMLSTLLGIIECLICCVLFILDVFFMTKVYRSTSFAFSDIFSHRPDIFNVIVALIVFEGLFIVAVVVKYIYQLRVHSSRDGKIGTAEAAIVDAAVLILLGVVREALYYVLLTCVNNYFQTMMTARSVLAILLFASFMTSSILYIFYRRKERKPTKELDIIRLVAIALTIVTSIVLIVLNIFVITNLKPGNDETPKLSDINVGIFNSADFNNIRNGDYQKDKYYDLRMLTTLDKIVESSKKRYSYSSCSRRRCQYFYYRIVEKNITCTSENSKFYDDCKNSSTSALLLRFEYLDDKKQYPRFGCGLISSNKCYKGCSLSSSYNVILTQEKSNGIELAWNNFAKCSSQPRGDIQYDSTIDVCSVMSINKFNWYTTFMGSLIFIFIARFDF